MNSISFFTYMGRILHGLSGCDSEKLIDAKRYRPVSGFSEEDLVDDLEFLKDDFLTSSQLKKRAAKLYEQSDRAE